VRLTSQKNQLQVICDKLSSPTYSQSIVTATNNSRLPPIEHNLTLTQQTPY